MHWSLVFGVGILPYFVATTCNCGYLMTDAQHEDSPVLFTHMLETNFTSMKELSGTPEWIKQQFNVSAQAGRGKFGKSFLPENVFLWPEADDLQGSAQSQGSLALRVGSQITSFNSITAAEVDTSRMDMLWGSYRATMKLSQVAGTCAAFFWYFNDTQEIDMEFLSREFDETNNVFAVNLVIHSSLSAKDGYDASNTGTFKTANLTFDPTKGFHEYRFDYLPGRVLFYADGQRLSEMKGNSVPSSSGHIILQHWSNGNPMWSGGPPAADAVVLVRSVKAYFNSSIPQSHADWHRICSNDGAKGATCVIPDAVPANTSDIGYPSNAGGRMSSNQTGEGDDNDGFHQAKLPSTTLTLLMAVCVLMMTG